MAISEKINNVDNKLNKADKKIKELEEEQSIAMQLIQHSKHQQEVSSKANTIIIIIILLLWFSTICGFIHYITHYTTQVVTETVDTDDGGNACIGDTCYNGDINYGESKKNN